MWWGERKWGSTDKTQAFDPSRPTDFGVWSSYLLSNQLSASNGIPSLIELSLLLSSVNCGGYLLQVKENPYTNKIFFVAVSCEELDSVKSQNAACSNEFLFLWRVHYAVKENVLTEQMRFLPLITYSEVVTHIIIFFDRGRFSSVGRVLDCRAGGRGFDSRGRTNTQGLKITEKWRYSLCPAGGWTFAWLGWPRKMAVPSPLGDVKIVSTISTFVLNTLTLK